MPQAEIVRQREHHDLTILRRVSDEVHDAAHGGQDVGMRQLHSLRPAGRTGRIHQDRQILRDTGDAQRPLGFAIDQDLDVEAHPIRLPAPEHDHVFDLQRSRLHLR